MDKPFSDAVRRFLLTSIPTVPHLETLLLLWREPRSRWLADEIASRLYVAPLTASTLADDLCRAELLECEGEPRRYQCRREPPSLVALIQKLDAAYSLNLREVTALIHSNVDRRAARFAQAFSWRKE